MKHAAQNHLLILALVAVCAMALPAVAQDPSDAKLEAVAHSYVDIMEIQQEYGPKIEAAETPEEAQAVQQEASEQIVEAIEERDGVTVDEYNQIMGEVQEDKQLRSRLIAAIDRAMADRDEG